MIEKITDCTLLNNGLKMPWLGFGVFKMKDDSEVTPAVRLALEAGYRSIDTASVYGNERGVGRASQGRASGTRSGHRSSRVSRRTSRFGRSTTSAGCGRRQYIARVARR